MHRRLLQTIREQSGQAMVEFALFASVLILVFAGIVDYSTYLRDQMELTEAAAAGAGLGAYPGQQQNFPAMVALAKAAAPDINNVQATAVNVYSCTPGSGPVSSGTPCSRGTPLMYVKVTTTGTVPAVLAWSGISGSITLQGQATYRVPWTP